MQAGVFTVAAGCRMCREAHPPPPRSEDESPSLCLRAPSWYREQTVITAAKLYKHTVLFAVFIMCVCVCAALAAPVVGYRADR